MTPQPTSSTAPPTPAGPPAPRKPPAKRSRSTSVPSKTLNNVAIDTAQNSTDEGDWPRGYQLSLSRDGSTWSTVATGAGTVKATTIGFPAQAARFFKITQTRSALQWWSIGELTAGLYTDDYSLNNTLTTRFGVAGAQSVIDTHQDTWLQDSDLNNIQAAGLNYIRVPIGWNTFLNLDGTWKSNPWQKLDWLVNGASQRGIYVLLDLHTVPGGDCSWGSCGRYGPSPNGFWGSPTYQTWTQNIWQAIAAHYKGNPGVAGYDLLNEPLIDPNENATDPHPEERLLQPAVPGGPRDRPRSPHRARRLPRTGRHRLAGRLRVEQTSCTSLQPLRHG